jgi:hypothetical protein
MNFWLLILAMTELLNKPGHCRIVQPPPVYQNVSALRARLWPDGSSKDALTSGLTASLIGSAADGTEGGPIAFAPGQNILAVPCR